MATKAQAPVVCDLCESDKEVNFYCVNCGQVLCARCKVIHLKSTRTRNDDVIPLSEARQKRKTESSVTLCHNHPTEEISLFCERCDQFICGECIDDKHQEHKIITLKKIKSKQEDLANFIQELQNKKSDFEMAMDTENTVHSQNTKIFDTIRTEISGQVNKIFEEVTSLRDENFSELSSLQQRENQRHSDACTNIQSQTQMLASAIKVLQSGIDSGKPLALDKAKTDASNLVQNVDIPPEAMKTTTKYKHGKINRPAVLPLFGDMSTEDKKIWPKQVQKINKPQISDVIQRKIDIKKIKVKTMQVTYTTDVINVLIPLTQQTAWVAGSRDKRLTMINKQGDTIKTSVQLCDGDSRVIDAKLYNNDFLVTCHRQQRVIRLSEDCKTVTTFRDMSPYYTRGLFVTQAMDVFVCLKSKLTSKDMDAKVVKLNSNGDVMQTIQHDEKGNVIYSWPLSVISLQSGEVIVSDRDQHMRVSCVKSEGHLVFTWSGEVQGEKVDKFDPMCITNDKYNNLFITDWNNHRVCVLNKDGTEATCLLDSTRGIQNPCGIALDDLGQLWVGCWEGKIHIIEYSHTVSMSTCI